MKKRLRVQFIGWAIGRIVVLLRWTCRIRVHDDPRGELSELGIKHVFALLHAHQVAASMAAERGTGAMVSRSDDGEMIVSALRAGGHIPIRGSSGSNKGGASALQALVEHVEGGKPAILAVDGPRGPRGSVHRGIALLAKKTDAAVLAVVAIPSRRWVLTRSWDRFQIPKPFSTIDCYFSAPLYARADESSRDFALRIGSQLNFLEGEFDLQEGTRSRPAGYDSKPAEASSTGRQPAA